MKKIDKRTVFPWVVSLILSLGWMNSCFADVLFDLPIDPTGLEAYPSKERAYLFGPRFRKSETSYIGRCRNASLRNKLNARQAAFIKSKADQICKFFGADVAVVPADGVFKTKESLEETLRNLEVRNDLIVTFNRSEGLWNPWDLKCRWCVENSFKTFGLSLLVGGGLGAGVGAAIVYNEGLTESDKTLTYGIATAVGVSLGGYVNGLMDNRSLRERNMDFEGPAIPHLVFDGKFQCLASEKKSFVSAAPIESRIGMTIGEYLGGKEQGLSDSLDSVSAQTVGLGVGKLLRSRVIESHSAESKRSPEDVVVHISE